MIFNFIFSKKIEMMMINMIAKVECSTELLYRKVYSHHKKSKKDHYFVHFLLSELSTGEDAKISVLLPVLSIIRIPTPKEDIVMPL